MTIGGDTLLPIRVNDSTVSIALPILRSGSYQVALAEPDLRSLVGRIEIAGFHSVKSISAVDGAPYPVFRMGSSPIILGGGSTLQRLDPTNGLVTSYPGYYLPSDYGASPSFRGSDVVVLRDSSGVAGEYRLTPSGLVFIDTVGNGLVNQYTRHLVPLRSDSYLITGSHQSYLYVNGAFQGSFTTESAWRISLSPDGSRLVLGSSVGLPGAQVFLNALADTVFTLPLQSVLGIAWTLDGSRLFATGGNQWNLHNHLAVVEAASGQVILRDSIPGDEASFWSLDVSRDGSHLFVLTQADSTFTVRVFDGSTLRQLGTLGGPFPVEGRCNACWAATVVLDEAFRKLHVVMPVSNTDIYTFDVLVD